MQHRSIEYSFASHSFSVSELLSGSGNEPLSMLGVVSFLLLTFSNSSLDFFGEERIFF